MTADHNNTARTPDGETGLSRPELQRLISRNVAVSIAAKAFYLITRFFLPPIILAFVSLEEYGIWATCFILISYLGMSAFGVSNVYIRYVADYHAKGETEKISGLLSTGLTVVTALSLILLAALWFCLPLIIDAFRVSPELRQTAFILIFGTVCVFMLDLSWGAFAYVLNGLQRIVEQNLVWVATFTLETVLIVVMLVAGWGIYALFYAFAVRYLVAITVNVFLCYRAILGLSLGLSRFDRHYLRLFYRFGAIVQLSGLLGMFLRSIEKVIAGVFINVQATGLFDVGEKFPVMATSIPSAMNAAFLPATAYMHSHGRRDEILALYLKGARYVNILTGGMMGFLAAFSGPLMVAWLGADPQFALAPFILSWFTLPYQLNVLTGPASAFFRGVGQPVRELLYPVAQLLLVALFTGLGFLGFGATVPVITVTVAAAMVVSAVLYMVYTNRFLALSQGMFFTRVILPGLLPYGIGFALLLAAKPWLPAALTDRWQAAAVVLAAGAAYGLATLLALFWLVWDKEERTYFRSRLAMIRRRVRRRRS